MVGGVCLKLQACHSAPWPGLLWTCLLICGLSSPFHTCALWGMLTARVLLGVGP